MVLSIVFLFFLFIFQCVCLEATHKCDYTLTVQPTGDCRARECGAAPPLAPLSRKVAYHQFSGFLPLVLVSRPWLVLRPPLVLRPCWSCDFPVGLETILLVLRPCRRHRQCCRLRLCFYRVGRGCLMHPRPSLCKPYYNGVCVCVCVCFVVAVWWVCS